MFPRQRQYETYDPIDFNQIGCGQIGGSKFENLGDLLSTAGKNITDVTKKIGAKLAAIKISDIGRLTGEVREKIFILVSKSLENKTVLDLFVKTFPPNTLKRFPAVIINKLPYETLKKLDINTLANKVSPKRLNEIVDDTAITDIGKNDFRKSILDVKKLNKENDELFELIRIEEAAKTLRWDGGELDAALVPSIKTSDDAALAIAKTDAQTDVATKVATDVATKAPTDVAKTTPTQAQIKVIKDSTIPDDTPDVLNKGTSETTEVAKVKQASWVSRNKGKTFVIGTASVGAIAYGGYALDNFIKKNNAPFNIIGMELDKTDPNNSIWLLYQVTPDTQFELTTNNWIQLEENNATPQIPIKKIYKIVEVNNDARKIRIFLQEKELPTSLGNTGKFLYLTTYGVQLEETAGDVAKGLVGTATSAATGAAKGVFGGLADAIGVSTKNLLIGAGVIIAIIFILLIIFMVMKSKSQ